MQRIEGFVFGIHAPNLAADHYRFHPDHPPAAAVQVTTTSYVQEVEYGPRS